MKKIAASLFVAVIAAGCGGKAKPATSGGDVAAADEHQGQHTAEEHPVMPAELQAFHDVLSPLWHAEGDDRQANACDAIGSFTDAAAALRNAAAPEGVDADAWMSAAEGLDAAVNDLAGPCTGGTAEAGAMPFDQAFQGVHDAFHVLLEMLPHAEG